MPFVECISGRSCSHKLGEEKCTKCNSRSLKRSPSLNRRHCLIVPYVALQSGWASVSVELSSEGAPGWRRMLDSWVGRAKVAVGGAEDMKATSEACLHTEFRSVTLPVESVVRGLLSALPHGISSEGLL